MNNKIKIYIYYNITEEPWGGGNSFLKAFRNYIKKEKSEEFEVVNSIDDDFDIFFVNGGHKDQGKYIDVEEVLKKSGKKGLKSFLKKPKKIIYRLDGARYKYNKSISEMDALQYKMLQNSDFVIFQSQECLDSFEYMGYKGKNYKIIFNGVNQELFNLNNKKFWDGKSKLKIFSANWSANQHKGYSTISEFSLNENVESSFVGNWNPETSQNKVKTLPPVRQEKLVGYYKQADVFLHAAENDPCPNVVIEAMSCGLPIIYHNSGGTKEISKDYGVNLPDDINSQTISDTLDKLRNNYTSIVENIKRDHANFSINQIAEEYLKVFKSVVKNV